MCVTTTASWSADRSASTRQRKADLEIGHIGTLLRHEAYCAGRTVEDMISPASLAAVVGLPDGEPAVPAVQDRRAEDRAAAAQAEAPDCRPDQRQRRREVGTQVGTRDRAA